jgi:hypothetical protein
MGEGLAEARQKLGRARKLLEEQQRRIARQRELIAHLENEAANGALLRSARESLRQLIKAHEAILREAAAVQEVAEVRLSMNSPPNSD